MKQVIWYLAILLLTSENIHAQKKIQAQSAYDFLNSIGVNSAIFRRGETTEKTIQCINYLGVRWIRTDDDMDTNKKFQEIKKLHQQTGVKISTSLGSSGNNIQSLINGSRRIALSGALLAIEGNNEPNNWGIIYNGEEGGKNKSWIPVARLQRDLYKAVKADSILKNYSVWTISESGAETDNVGLQYLYVPKEDSDVIDEFRGTTFGDAVNCHNYFTHPSWQPLQDNQTWLAASPTKNAKGDHLYGNYGKTWLKGYNGYKEEELEYIKRVTTETGVTIDGVVTEEMQARLYLSCYLAQFAQGWSHTAIYIMRDRSDESGNQSFGFYDKEYRPRRAAHYLHNMTTILKDNNRLKRADSLSYYLSGESATTHDLLLQKSDGTFMLIIWGEMYTGGETEIEVKLSKKHQIINIYDPTQGIYPTNSVKNVQSIVLTISNHPYILEIKK